MRSELKRSVGTLGFFALAFGSMIGVGWVTALGGWLESAGPLGAVLAFVAGSGLILLIGLCYAELCAMLPVAGGEVAYAYTAFGTSKSYGIGSLLAFGYLAVSVFEAISVAKVVGYLWPGIDQWPLYTVAGEVVYGSQLALSLVTTALITGINYRGVGPAARLQSALVLLFGLAALVFVAAGIFGGSLDHLSPAFGAQLDTGEAMSGSASLSGFAVVFVTVPFWFVGFDTIPQAAEEAEEAVAPRALARLIVISILGATSFYVLVIVAVGMSSPWTGLVAGDLVAAEAFEQAFGSPLLANLVLVAALLGLFTSWNGFFLAGSRVLFALGRGCMAPPALGWAHPEFRTPSKAILLAGAFTFAGACLGRGALGVFINVGSFFMALAFLGVTLSMLKLRRSHPGLDRPFRAPGGAALPIVASVGGLGIVLAMALPFSPAALTQLEWIVLTVVVILVIVGWFVGARARAATTESERATLVLGEYAERR